MFVGDGWLQVVVLAGRAVQRNDKRPCDQTSFIGKAVFFKGGGVFLFILKTFVLFQNK